jgi:hypothetical protein
MLENAKLKLLLRELLPDDGLCPFSVDDEAARIVSLSHYRGGRDATYVFVSPKSNGKLLRGDRAVTIRYSPFVAGTTIIYDLNDEMLQGKARPFVCNLDQQVARVYAVLPFQIEVIDLKIAKSADGPCLRVAFLDARGETVRATLPFELRLVSSNAEQLGTKYLATDRQGGCCEALGQSKSNFPAKIVVRSLATGHEQSTDLR